MCKEGSKKIPEKEITAQMVAASSPASFDVWDARSSLLEGPHPWTMIRDK